jgi:hypothetical protein
MVRLGIVDVGWRHDAHLHQARRVNARVDAELQPSAG